MIDVALERFVEFMDSGGLTYVAAFVVGLSILVFVSIVVHELGHAVVALACTDGLVLLRVGRTPGVLRGRIGRLAYSVDLRWGDEPNAGLAEVMADLGRVERIALALGGPAANVALAVALTPLALSLTGVSRYVVGAAIVLSTYVAVANLVSRTEGSDGRMALAAIRGAIPLADDHAPLTGEIANTLGRWMALYSNLRDPSFSYQRAFLFGVAPLELGVDPQVSSGEASRYWNTARAGWCWREVQPAAAEVVADLAHRAWRNQSLGELRGLELAAAAAAEAARDSRGLEVYADVEAGFLATTDLREGITADDSSRFAFQFGVALHDVERVLAEHGQRYW